MSRFRSPTVLTFKRVPTKRGVLYRVADRFEVWCESSRRRNEHSRWYVRDLVRADPRTGQPQITLLSSRYQAKHFIAQKLGYVMKETAR